MVMITRYGAKNACNVSGVSPAKAKLPRTRNPLKHRNELSVKLAARLEATKNARVKEDLENDDNPSVEVSYGVPSWQGMSDSLERFPSTDAYTMSPHRVASASVFLDELPDEPSNWMDDVWQVPVNFESIVPEFYN